MAQKTCSPLNATSGWRPTLQDLDIPLRMDLPAHATSVLFTAANGPQTAALMGWRLSVPAALPICYLITPNLPEPFPSHVQCLRISG
jgi:hypothetical protein